MRRTAALAGLLVLVMLALTLLWRVYRHHHASDPYDREQPAVVRLDDFGNFDVKTANDLR